MWVIILLVWCPVYWPKLRLRATGLLSDSLKRQNKPAGAFLHLAHCHHRSCKDSQNLQDEVTCSNGRKLRSRLSLYLRILNEIKAFPSSCKLAVHSCILLNMLVLVSNNTPPAPVGPSLLTAAHSIPHFLTWACYAPSYHLPGPPGI